MRRWLVMKAISPNMALGEQHLRRYALELSKDLGGSGVAKVFTTIEILPHTGVNVEDLRKLVSEGNAALPFPGVHSRLLKGDRGDREGKYIILMEYDSLETRNRFSPQHDVISEEAKTPSGAAYMERWQSLIARSMYTDYVEEMAGG